MDKDEALRTLNHLTHLIQYTIDALADDVNPHRNVNKYHKLLDSIALHIDLVKEYVGDAIALQESIRPHGLPIKSLEYDRKPKKE